LPRRAPSRVRIWAASWGRGYRLTCSSLISQATSQIPYEATVPCRSSLLYGQRANSVENNPNSLKNNKKSSHMHATSGFSNSDLAELFAVSRPTINLQNFAPHRSQDQPLAYYSAPSGIRPHSRRHPFRNAPMGIRPKNPRHGGRVHARRHSYVSDLYSLHPAALGFH